MDEGTGAREAVGEINLASLLNILWRRRFIALGCIALGVAAGIAYGIVVTPLYRGTATIRPGITAFNPNGGASREWQLKDVQRFFGTRLYAESVGEKLGTSARRAPIIEADFVMRGLQNIQGGNVITLSVLEADRGRAARVLEVAIEAFEEYATTDTFSNSIALTRRGLQIQIETREKTQQRLVAQLDSLDTEIALAKAESSQIYTTIALAETEVAQVESDNARIRTKLDRSDARRQQIVDRIEELDGARQAAAARISGSSTPDGTGLRPGTALTETEVYRALVRTTADLQGRLAVALSRQDSLQIALQSNQDVVDQIRQQARQEVELARIEIARTLGQLRFARHVGIPSRVEHLDLQIDEREAQIMSLSPVERIGSIIVSEGPVRPRKQRATLILTFLATIGGIALAYVVDYVAGHREEIFRA